MITAQERGLLLNSLKLAHILSYPSYGVSSGLLDATGLLPRAPLLICNHIRSILGPSLGGVVPGEAARELAYSIRCRLHLGGAPIPASKSCERGHHLMRCGHGDLLRRGDTRREELS